MEAIWNQLYDAAKTVLNPRQVSSIIEAGGVAAAIESVWTVPALSAFARSATPCFI